MKNALNTIQTVTKIAEIVCKVLKIVCIVGACLSLVGIVCLAAGLGTVSLFGVSIVGLVEAEADASIPQIYFSLVESALVTASLAVVSHYIALYCHNEQAAGTPFTAAGAAELFKVGLITAVLPLAVSIVVAIAAGIVSLFTKVDPSAGINSTVGMGITLILVALICKHGADLTETKSAPDSAE